RAALFASGSRASTHLPFTSTSPRGHSSGQMRPFCPATACSATSLGASVGTAILLRRTNFLSACLSFGVHAPSSAPGSQPTRLSSAASARVSAAGSLAGGSGGFGRAEAEGRLARRVSPPDLLTAPPLS